MLILANFHLPVQIFSISPLRAHLRFILCFPRIKLNSTRLRRIFYRVARTVQNSFLSIFPNSYGGLSILCVFFRHLSVPNRYQRVLSVRACKCMGLFWLLWSYFAHGSHGGTVFVLFTSIWTSFLHTHQSFVVWNPKSPSRPPLSSVYLVVGFACVYLEFTGIFFLIWHIQIYYQHIHIGSV